MVLTYLHLLDPGDLPVISHRVSTIEALTMEEWARALIGPSFPEMLRPDEGDEIPHLGGP